MRLLLLPMCILVAATSFAQSVSTLIVPRDPVPAGSVIVVEWMMLNPSATEVASSTPTEAAGTLHVQGSAIPVTLRATSDSSGVIPAGGFTFRRFDLQLPQNLTGKVVLEVAQDGAAPLRAAIDVRQESGSPEVQEETRLSSLASSANAAPTIVRTFAGRLSPHEPIYFLYGPDDPAAKFQFSFKYRLLTLGDGSDRFSPPTVQFGFTQRSLWDIAHESSPFYDTSYIPEFMFESLAPREGKTEGLFNFLGYQLGSRHESNGQDGALSRSLNTVYLRGAWAVGALDDWHLLVIPEFYGYVGDLSNNERIKEYRGFGQLRLVFGTNDGPSLTGTVWAGEDFQNVSYQLDLSIPVTTRLFDFETYLTVQYFNGYGESLLAYESMTETIRAGVSFVR
jgi:phospholipase A1/A2